MQKIYKYVAAALLLVLAAALYGCKGGFSKGTKIDMTTGLSASYNGFSLEDIYLATGENDTRISSNKVTLNSKISILATGVTAPVLPTWNSTPTNLLVACLALNL